MDPTHVYMRRHLTYPTYVICPLCPGPANQPTNPGPLAENKSTLVPFFVFYTHIMYFWAAITGHYSTESQRDSHFWHGKSATVTFGGYTV
jgi:hypothetical protein